MECESYVLRAVASRHERGGLCLSKDSAHTVNGKAGFPLQGEIPEFLNGYLKTRCHEFQELARSGCASIVHLKLADATAIVQRYGLGILTADIQNRATIRE
jgi:hypothetical protein